jgi:ribulose 1,5-bisphosphate synthetase/thiazole synthase
MNEGIPAAGMTVAAEEGAPRIGPSMATAFESK